MIELIYDEKNLKDVSIDKIGNSFFYIKNHLNNQHISNKNNKIFLNKSIIDPTQIFKLAKLNYNLKILTNKIKIHFSQNFYFENPFFLEIKINQLNKKQFNILNVILNDLDELEFNERPFIRNGLMYNSYIEYEIISVEYLVLDWIRNGNKKDSISRLLLGDYGIDNNSVYEIEFGILDMIEVFNDYTQGGKLNRTSYAALPKRDNLVDLSCFVKESNEGDFFECGFDYVDGLKGLMDDFISIGKNFYIIHEISIIEYIPYDWREPNNGNWELTDTYQVIKQMGDYEPFLFRPILKRDDVSPMFRIHYIGKMIDNESGEEIWKEASFISKKSRKYGKKYPISELYREVPIINIIEENSINVLNNQNSNENVFLTKTELIPVWFNSLIIQNNNISVIGTFKMPHFSSSYITEFIFDLDSSLLKDCYLEFVNDDGTSTICSELKTNTSLLRGHISFQISDDESKTISKYNSKTVRIIKNGNVLAFGTWEFDSIYSNDIFIQNFKNQQIEIQNLKNQINILKQNQFKRPFKFNVDPFELKQMDINNP